MKKRVLIALMVLAAQAASPRPSAAQAGGWWNADYRARRTVKAVAPAGVEADRLVGVATFMTHGHLRDDGADVRVVARGRLVPSKVLRVGPGDFVTVAFQPSSDLDTYAVYYGNAQADPADDPGKGWSIAAGVLLEVRAFKGGSFNNLRQAEATWAKSKDVMGAGFVPNVYFGYNPFGRSHSFMARYTGWLDLEKAGRYDFATTSSNGSFLLVDGKEVVSWPGPHRPIRRARHMKTVVLNAGRHKLEYLHIHTWGDPVAVAAWKPPGARRPVPIPPAAFVPVAHAIERPEQVRGERVTPDFDFSRADAFLDPDRGTFLYRFTFRDVTEGITKRFYHVEWDFGDGVTSTVWDPTHVYLAPGTYTVTQKIKGPAGTFTAAQKLLVERDWAHQADDTRVDPLRRFLPVVRQYDLTKLPAESLAAACELFDRVEAHAELARASRQLVYATPDVPGELLARESERLAGIYLHRMKDPAAAAEVYLHAEKTLAGDGVKAGMLFRAAKITRVELNDLPTAETHYRRALTLYGKSKPEIRRRAHLGIAECAILTGKADLALKELKKAEAISIPSRRDARADAVRVGHLSRAIEDYLRRGELDAAAELLDAWEWEFPLDRLAGYSTVLRARRLLLREEYAKAERLLTSLVAVNPKGNYAAEALLLAGDAFAKLGDKTKAADTYKRVIREYPESPFVKDANRRAAAVESGK